MKKVSESSPSTRCPRSSIPKDGFKLTTQIFLEKGLVKKSVNVFDEASFLETGFNGHLEDRKLLLILVCLSLSFASLPICLSVLM
jgi:hypothetical protein